MLAKYC